MSSVFVSGASGYIGKHITLQLLNEGYTVRASVRSTAKSNEVIAAVKPHLVDPAAINALSFVELDLLSDDGWTEALQGIDVLMHTASPFTIDKVKDENVLIRPAVDGTLRALRAAHAAGVKRVILTSSVAAIEGVELGQGATAHDETNWTDVSSPLGSDPYTKSKTLAERAAWDYIANEAPEIAMTTINPVMVLGAPLDRNYGASVSVLERVLDAKDPAMPDIAFSIVDVQDVAMMHVSSIGMKEAEGQRYIAASDTMTFVDIAKVLKRTFPNKKIVTRQAPKFLMLLLSLFDAQIRSIVPRLGKPIRINSKKAQSAFGFSFIGVEQSIVETATFLMAETGK